MKPDRKPKVQEPASSPASAFLLVPTGAVDELRAQVERLAALVENRPAPAVDAGEKAGYVEPGPNSPRQYFTPEELSDRWKWGMTKVYEISELDLPFWKKGQLKRYFWAYVWAFEGRLSREEADRIHAVQTSELPLLANPPAKVTRLRQPGSALDEGHQ